MKTCDTRDFTKDPPAELDVESIRRMRGMVKDAAEHGDLDWPYCRYPVQAPWTHKRGDWVVG